MSTDESLFSVSDAALRDGTGHPHDYWFDLLDGWGAREREHATIAAWLLEEQGLEGWWAQTVTVDYERARGLRPKGGHRDGTFDANASKTVNVPVGELFRAVIDPDRREGWLPEGGLTERTARPDRSARFDWGDGRTRVNVYFTAKGAGKSQVSLQHQRLPDREAAEERKGFWRERLGALKTLLEGDGR